MLRIKVQVLIGVCFLAINKEFDRDISFSHNEGVKERYPALIFFFMRKLDISCEDQLCLDDREFPSAVFMNDFQDIINIPFPQLRFALHGCGGYCLLLQPFHEEICHCKTDWTPHGCSKNLSIDGAPEAEVSCCQHKLKQLINILNIDFCSIFKRAVL